MDIQNNIKRNKSAGANRADKKLRRKKFIKWFFILFVFLAELLIYTGARVACISAQYQIAQEKKMQKKIKAYHSELMVEQASLSSPERIFKIAGTKLGLVMPKHDQIIYITGETGGQKDR